MNDEWVLVDSADEWVPVDDAEWSPVGDAVPQPQYQPWAQNVTRVLEPIARGGLKAAMIPSDILEWAFSKATGVNKDGPSPSTAFEMLANQAFGTQDIIDEAQKEASPVAAFAGDLGGFVTESLAGGKLITGAAQQAKKLAAAGQLASFLAKSKAGRMVPEVASSIANTKTGRLINSLGSGLTTYNKHDVASDIASSLAQATMNQIDVDDPYIRTGVSLAAGMSPAITRSAIGTTAKGNYSMPWNKSIDEKANEIIKREMGDVPIGDNIHTRTLFEQAKDDSPLHTRVALDQLENNLDTAEVKKAIGTIPEVKKSSAKIGGDLQKELKALKEAEILKVREAYAAVPERKIKIGKEEQSALDNAVKILDKQIEGSPLTGGLLGKIKKDIKDVLGETKEVASTKVPAGFGVDAPPAPKKKTPTTSENWVRNMTQEIIGAKEKLGGTAARELEKVRQELLKIASPELVAANNLNASVSNKFTNPVISGIVGKISDQAESLSGAKALKMSPEAVAKTSLKVGARDIKTLSGVLGVDKTRRLIKPAFDKFLRAKIEKAMTSGSIDALNKIKSEVTDRKEVYSFVYGSLDDTLRHIDNRIKETGIRSAVTQAKKGKLPEDEPMINAKFYLSGIMPGPVGGLFALKDTEDMLNKAVLQSILAKTARGPLTNVIRQPEEIGTVTDLLAKALARSTTNPISTPGGEQ